MDLILSGHNALILGNAGTGKSYTVKRIVNELKSQGNKVFVTATTGIACTIYESESAMTIHKWSGIGDGRLDTSVIRNVIQHNASFANVRERVLTADVLFIDECSMLSKKFISSLDQVCKIRNNCLPFGGLQIVLCGDFRQLPPVPNSLYEDDGDFCFQAAFFDKVFPHRILLTEVVRQTELPLIKAIMETATGDVTNDTISVIQSLQRPLGCSTTKLYACNDQVEDYNRKCITEFDGQLYEFKSTDTGKQKFLNTVLAPRTLWLKVGAPVMLLRNITDKLVNGLRGTVVDITEAGPVVEFPTLRSKIPMEKIKFSVFSPKENRDVACREQYPIKLAFAITIHKAQGLTLDNVEVDCRKIFKAGQFSVALGRARSMDGLRVLHFSREFCLQQPECLQMFYTQGAFETANLQEDMKCCRHSIGSKMKSPIVTVQDMIDMEGATELVEYNEEEAFDDDFDAVVSGMLEDRGDNVQLPEDLDLKKILEDVACKKVVTPTQYTINSILKSVDQHKYQQFCKKEYDKLFTMLSELQPNPESMKPISTSEQCKFYAQIHMYHTIFEYRMSCMTFFYDNFTEDHLDICISISTSIRQYLMKKVADKFPTSNRNISKRSVSVTSHARIRYIAVYCLAKLHYKLSKKKQTYRYDLSSKGQDLYKGALCAVQILDSLKNEEHYVQSTTKYQYTLENIERRQNKTHVLTYVSDGLFEVFLKLTEKCMSLLVDKTFNEKGGQIFTYMMDSVMGDNIYQEFLDVVLMTEVSSDTEFEESTESESDIAMKTEQVNIIFQTLVKLYLKVLVNQFRKDIIENFNISKKMAHRKQVRVQSSKSGSKKKDKQEIVSSEKGTEGISGKGRKGKGSQKKGKGKGKQTSVSLKKNTVLSESEDDFLCEQTVRRSSSSSDEMERNLSVADTAGSSGTRRSKRKIIKRKNPEESDSEDEMSVVKRKKAAEVTETTVTARSESGHEEILTIQTPCSESVNAEDNEVCAVCGTADKELVWIQCDGCDLWYHRNCAGLKHHLSWKKANRKGSKWYCKDCK